MKILIVEPSATLRRIVASMLHQIGHAEITAAGTTAELETGAFDLAIVSQPLAEQIAGHVTARHVILMRDSDAPADDEGHATLQKPFSADQLAMAIAALPHGG